MILCVVRVFHSMGLYDIVCCPSVSPHGSLRYCVLSECFSPWVFMILCVVRVFLTMGLYDIVCCPSVSHYGSL